jgi:ABC-type molybdate transport system substrate-binding protein
MKTESRRVQVSSPKKCKAGQQAKATLKMLATFSSVFYANVFQ